MLQRILVLMLLISSFGDILKAQQTVLSGFDSIIEFQIAPNGSMYVLDEDRSSISRFSKNAELEFSIGSAGFGSSHFGHARSLHLGAGLKLLVADSENKKVVQFDRNLQYLGEVNEKSSEKLKNWEPVYAVSMQTGEFWVFDNQAKELIRFDENGQIRMKSSFPIGIEVSGISKMVISNSFINVIDDSYSTLFQFSFLGKYEKFIPLPKETKAVQWNKDSFVLLIADTLSFRDEKLFSKNQEVKISIEETQLKMVRDLTIQSQSVYIVTNNSIVRVL